MSNRPSHGSGSLSTGTPADLSRASAAGTSSVQSTTAAFAMIDGVQTVVVAGRCDARDTDAIAAELDIHMDRLAMAGGTEPFDEAE